MTARSSYSTPQAAAPSHRRTSAGCPRTRAALARAGSTGLPLLLLLPAVRTVPAFGRIALTLDHIVPTLDHIALTLDRIDLTLVAAVAASSATTQVRAEASMERACGSLSSRSRTVSVLANAGTLHQH